MSSSLKQIADQIGIARSHGALYHPSNPLDSWFCTSCSVFGRGETRCWSCDGEVEFKWVPLFGGGAQNYNPCAEMVEPTIPVQEWHLTDVV